MPEAPAEKSCINCCYYAQHYTKSGTRILKTDSGHCSNPKRKSFNPTLCKRWKDGSAAKEETKASIKKTLEQMSLRLSDIAEILKDDV